MPVPLARGTMCKCRARVDGQPLLRTDSGYGKGRTAPLYERVHRMLDATGAVLTGYDPEVPSERQRCRGEVRLVDDPYQVTKGASAVMLLTERPEFAELDWSVTGAAASTPVVVDTRGRLGPPAAREPGIERIVQIPPADRSAPPTSR